MSLKPKHAIGLATMVAITIGGLTASPAVASTATPPPGAVTAPMTIEGFNAAVASAHGYRIVVLANGEEASVPASSAIVNGSPASAVAQPDTIIYGDCGYSWMYMDSWSPLQYVPLTGFVVYDPGWDFSWEVSVVGPYNYERNLSYGGLLSGSESWSNGAPEIPVDDAGYYDGAVVPGSSFVILENGGLCVSGGPSDRVYVS
jgi:hypothetical protein